MEKIDISVIILTYNADLEKIYFTLNSILTQKNVSFELILADDASENNHFDEIREYLTAKKCKHYILVEHKVNQGTVVNLLDAVKQAKGRFIKALGAGDALCYDNVLQEWISYVKEKNALVSFCNARYFVKNQMDKICYIRVKDNPQRPYIYVKENVDIMKKFFLLYNDLVLGAKFMIERNILEKYLSDIVGKVKLAEDNIFRIMLCENIPFYYFDKYAIYYEYGTGVWSSKSSKYSCQLKQDWNNTNKIIRRYCLDDIYGKRLKMSLNDFGEKRKILDKLRKRIVLFDYYCFKIIIKIFPRYTG